MSTRIVLSLLVISAGSATLQGCVLTGLGDETNQKKGPVTFAYSDIKAGTIITADEVVERELK